MNRGLQNSIKEQFTLEMVSATNIKIATKGEWFCKRCYSQIGWQNQGPILPSMEWPSIVTPKYVSDILTQTDETLKLLPNPPLIKEWFGLDYKDYPLNFGLPRNKEVGAYIAGTDGSNRTYLPTPAEVFKHFKSTTGDKLGIDLKIKQILDLHGETAKYDNKYVTWRK